MNLFIISISFRQSLNNAQLDTPPQQFWHILRRLLSASASRKLKLSTIILHRRKRRKCQSFVPLALSTAIAHKHRAPVIIIIYDRRFDAMLRTNWETDSLQHCCSIPRATRRNAHRADQRVASHCIQSYCHCSVQNCYNAFSISTISIQIALVVVGVCVPQWKPSVQIFPLALRKHWSLPVQATGNMLMNMNICDVFERFRDWGTDEITVDKYRKRKWLLLLFIWCVCVCVANKNEQNSSIVWPPRNFLSLQNIPLFSESCERKQEIPVDRKLEFTKMLMQSEINERKKNTEFVYRFFVVPRNQHKKNNAEDQQTKQHGQQNKKPARNHIIHCRNGRHHYIHFWEEY